MGTHGVSRLGSTRRGSWVHCPPPSPPLLLPLPLPLALPLVLTPPEEVAQAWAGKGRRRPRAAQRSLTSLSTRRPSLPAASLATQGGLAPFRRAPQGYRGRLRVYTGQGQGSPGGRFPGGSDQGSSGFPRGVPLSQHGGVSPQRSGVGIVFKTMKNTVLKSPHASPVRGSNGRQSPLRKPGVSLSRNGSPGPNLGGTTVAGTATETAQGLAPGTGTATAPVLWIPCLLVK